MDEMTRVIARAYLEDVTAEEALNFISQQVNRLLSVSSRGDGDAWEKKMAMEVSEWHKIGTFILELNRRVNNLDDSPTIVA